MKNHSNRVSINDCGVELPVGIICTNFFDHHEMRFRHRQRKHTLQHLVIHETAGTSAKGCKRTLQRKGLGVQLIIARNGRLSCHGDLLLDVMSHAGRLNKTSIGIEVVNPYAPKFCRPEYGPYSYKKAEWWTWCPNKKDRRYVLPTVDQLSTLRKLVPWLCAKLEIPYMFPTRHLNKKQPRIPGAWRGSIPRPGIIAHRDFGINRADGRFLLEYLMQNAGLEVNF